MNGGRSAAISTITATTSPGLPPGFTRAEFRIKRTPLISPPSWPPARPVDLAGIEMAWVTDAPAPRVTGAEPETQPVRPLRVPGRQFDRYTAAIRYQARSKRPCTRTGGPGNHVHNASKPAQSPSRPGLTITAGRRGSWPGQSCEQHASRRGPAPQPSPPHAV